LFHEFIAAPFAVGRHHLLRRGGRGGGLVLRFALGLRSACVVK
jgi:hypothetical protein